MKRRCLSCSTLTTGSYCTACARKRKALRNAEAPRCKATVEAWVQTHGWRCPGYRRPPHPSRDLTADHSVPFAHGGTGSPLTVLCRSCNASKGTRTD